MTPQISTYEEELVTEIRKTPIEYLPNLLEIVRLYRESVTLKPAEVTFGRGWEAAAAGETRPLDELWEDDGANHY